MRRIEDGQDDLSRQRKCLDDIRDQISRERRELERIQGDRAHAASEASSAKEEAQHEHHLAERLRRQIEDLRNSMDLAREDLGKLRKEKLSIQAELDDTRAALEDEKQIERTLATRLDGRKAEMSAVAMDGQALVESIKAKRERAEALREDLAKIEGEKNAAVAAVRAAEKEKARLDAECASRNELLTKSRAALEKMRKEQKRMSSLATESLEDDVVKYDDTNSTIEALEKRYHERIKQLKEAYVLKEKKLRDTISKLRDDMERRGRELKNERDAFMRERESGEQDVVQYEDTKSTIGELEERCRQRIDQLKEEHALKEMKLRQTISGLQNEMELRTREHQRERDAYEERGKDTVGEEEDTKSTIHELEERYRKGIEQLKKAYNLKEAKLRETITTLENEIELRTREHEKERDALSCPQVGTNLADFSNQIREGYRDDTKFEG